MGFVAAYFLLRSAGAGPASEELQIRNPFEFGMAFKFGLFLAAVVILSHAALDWFGEGGVYVLAGLSGLADVDAVTLSLARISGAELSPAVAAWGILLASLANTLLKCGVAVFNAGRPLFWPLALSLGASLVAGALAAVLAV